MTVARLRLFCSRDGPLECRGKAQLLTLIGRLSANGARDITCRKGQAQSRRLKWIDGANIPRDIRKTTAVPLRISPYLNDFKDM